MSQSIQDIEAEIAIGGELRGQSPSFCGELRGLSLSFCLSFCRLKPLTGKIEKWYHTTEMMVDEITIS